VLSVEPSLESDWSGEPAAFFLIVLTDAASRRDQLLKVMKQVSHTIVQQVQPLEKWGVLPYFNYRSESEQARITQQTLAS
jgi:hypothetical protein